MKKLFAALLAVLMVVSMATIASAETTTLTTTVPDATYTLNIPADQEIPFGATSADIGNVTVTESASFAEGKNLKVSVTYEPFSSEDAATTIPFTLRFHNRLNSDSYIDVASGEAVSFLGKADGTVNEKVLIKQNESLPVNQVLLMISSTNWGKALAGEYSATITFAAEVVAEE